MKVLSCALLVALASCSLHTGINPIEDPTWNAPGWDGSKVGPNRLTLSAAVSSTTASPDGGSDVDIDSQFLSFSWGRLIEGTSLEPGIRLFVSNTDIDFDDGGDTRETDFALAGNLRLYFLNDMQVRPFIEGFGGFAYSRFDGSDIGSDSDTGPILGAGVGIMAFVSPGASFQVDVTYTYLDVFDVEVDDISLNVGVSMHF